MNDSAGWESMLDDELVPLSVAATVTYFHLAPMSAGASEKNLAEAVKRVAFALAAVAPIRGANGNGNSQLTPKEAEQALFRGLDGNVVDLDGFAIRRGDLRAAIAALKKADVAEL